MIDMDELLRRNDLGYGGQVENQFDIGREWLRAEQITVDGGDPVLEIATFQLGAVPDQGVHLVAVVLEQFPDQVAADESRAARSPVFSWSNFI